MVLQLRTLSCCSSRGINWCADPFAYQSSDTMTAAAALSQGTQAVHKQAKVVFILLLVC